MAIVLTNEDKLMLGGLGLALVGLVAFIITDPPDPPENQTTTTSDSELTLKDKFPIIYSEYKKKYRIPETGSYWKVHGWIPTKVGINLEKLVNKFGATTYVIYFYDDDYAPSVISTLFVPREPNTAYVEAEITFPTKAAEEAYAVRTTYIEDMIEKIKREVGEPSIIRLQEETETHCTVYYESRGLNEEKLRKLFDILFGYIGARTRLADKPYPEYEVVMAETPIWPKG